jgi:hypothetical protein
MALASQLQSRAKSPSNCITMTLLIASIAATLAASDKRDASTTFGASAMINPVGSASAAAAAVVPRKKPRRLIPARARRSEASASSI